MRISSFSLAPPLLFFSLLNNFVNAYTPTPYNGTRIPTPSGYQAVLNVGVILPNPNDTNIGAETTVLIISEFGLASLQIAANDVNQNNVIPGVYVNLLYEYSSLDPSQSADEIFDTTDLARGNISALIGDIISDVTEYSAVMTGKLQIPQCSFAASAVSLSDKTLYPYFFRTTANNYRYAEAVAQYVLARGWGHVGVLTQNNDYGDSFSEGISNFAASNPNLTILSQRSIYQFFTDDPTDDLLAIKASGATIILLFLNNDTLTIETLLKAKTPGIDMLNENFVWIIFNNIQADIQTFYSNNPNGTVISDFNGLVMVDLLFNLTEFIPQYDDFLSKWLAFPDLDLHGQSPDDLTFYQGNAYDCLMVIARGFNQSLNQYPGGRIAGIEALQQQRYNTENLIPAAFNTNYTGPSGYINFSDQGDIEGGNFAIFYVWNGTSVLFASNVNNTVLFQQPQRFSGGSYNVPADEPASLVANPDLSTVPGKILSSFAAFGIFICLVIMVIVILYRNERVIKASSPFFCCIELVGIILGYIGVFLLIARPTNAIICFFRPIVLSLGFVLVMSGIILKSYRVYRIFNNVFATRIGIRDTVLMRFAVFLIFIDAIPIILWFSIQPQYPTIINIQSGMYFYSCGSRDIGISGSWASPFEIILILYMVLLGFYAVFLAYKTRNVSSVWSEAKWIAYVSYNVLFAGIICLPTLFLPDSESITCAYLRLIALLYAATFTLLILFLPKLNDLFNPYASSGDPTRLGGISSMSGRGIVGGGPFRQQNFNASDGMGNRRNSAEMILDAHEGLMPVKVKRKWLGLFASWYMRKVVVIPSLKYFLLIDEQTQMPTAVYYSSSEPVITGRQDEHVFKVKGISDYEYIMQVKDESTVENWVQIFNNVPHSSQPQAPAEISDLTTPTQPSFVAQASPEKKETTTETKNTAESSTASSIIRGIFLGRRNTFGNNTVPTAPSVQQPSNNQLSEANWSRPDLSFGGINKNSNTFGETEEFEMAPNNT